MKRLLDKIEKYLVRGVILGLICLVVVQALLTRDPLRFYLSWGERMEGQKLEYPVGTLGEEEETLRGKQSNNKEEVVSPWGQLTLSLQDYSSLAKVRVLVNNEEVADFTNREIELKVMAGDVIEIDSTYYNFPIEFRITKVSPNLSAPSVNQSFTSNQGLIMVGKVIVK